MVPFWKRRVVTGYLDYNVYMTEGRMTIDREEVLCSCTNSWMSQIQQHSLILGGPAHTQLAGISRIRELRTGLPVLQELFNSALRIQTTNRSPCTRHHQQEQAGLLILRITSTHYQSALRDLTRRGTTPATTCQPPRQHGDFPDQTRHKSSWQ